MNANQKIRDGRSGRRYVFLREEFNNHSLQISRRGKIRGRKPKSHRSERSIGNRDKRKGIKYRQAERQRWQARKECIEKRAESPSPPRSRTNVPCQHLPLTSVPLLCLPDPFLLFPFPPVLPSPAPPAVAAPTKASNFSGMIGSSPLSVAP